MIVFLTLCYCAVLAILVKVGIVKLNLFWKLSPLLWLLLLFVVLFIPMQWGAPGGPVNVYQYVVEVIPNVTGEVVDVPVEPLKPLNKGDVLFTIDPIPYQAKVDQLAAQLEAAKQNVEQLKAAAEAAEATVTKTEEEIEIRKSDSVAAAAKVVVAEVAIKQAETGVERQTNLVVDLKVQVEAAGRELERRKTLLEKGAGSQSEVDQAQVNYSGLESQLNISESDLEAAEQNLAGAKASLDAEQANARSTDLQLQQLLNADLPRAKANARQAKLAAESMFGDEHTSVASVLSQLAAAQFDLDNTVVRAPAKGHVMAVTLRPGQRVASFPVRSWMPFIDHEQSEILVVIQQNALRHVKAGQPAEITFKMFPGKVFPAKVDRIVYTNPAGQLQPSGTIAVNLSNYENAHPFGAVLALDDESIVDQTLSGGASGSAAIYTESMKATHIIRRVMLRMDAWMNYLIP